MNESLVVLFMSILWLRSHQNNILIQPVYSKINYYSLRAAGGTSQSQNISCQNKLNSILMTTILRSKLNLKSLSLLVILSLYLFMLVTS
jgi:hypothetical protein